MNNNILAEGLISDFILGIYCALLLLSCVRVAILLTKTIAAQNEDALSYHRLRRLYFLVVVFEATIRFQSYEELLKDNSVDILAYGKLLETNKPYLTDVTRTPGLTTSLLGLHLVLRNSISLPLSITLSILLFLAISHSSTPFFSFSLCL